MPELRRMLPSSNALFVFDAAARNGSFTAAAAELNVTQPAVSRMLGQFEEHLGVKLPESLKITAHAESENSLHFVIPQTPAQKLDELSDEELEKVAGGVTPTVTLIVASLMASATGTAFGVVVSQRQGNW